MISLAFFHTINNQEFPVVSKSWQTLAVGLINPFLFLYIILYTCQWKLFSWDIWITKIHILQYSKCMIRVFQTKWHNRTQRSTDRRTNWWRKWNEARGGLISVTISSYKKLALWHISPIFQIVGFLQTYIE